MTTSSLLNVATPLHSGGAKASGHPGTSRDSGRSNSIVPNSSASGALLSNVNDTGRDGAPSLCQLVIGVSATHNSENGKSFAPNPAELTGRGALPACTCPARRGLHGPYCPVNDLDAAAPREAAPIRPGMCAPCHAEGIPALAIDGTDACDECTPDPLPVTVSLRDSRNVGGSRV